jgi:hypothetical protein
MNDDRIELAGDTSFTRNGEYEMLHRTIIEIEPGKVTTTVSGHGEGCAPVDPVVSDHPAVERYQRAIDRALAISAYRNRPIVTRFKTDKKGRKRTGRDDA